MVDRKLLEQMRKYYKEKAQGFDPDWPHEDPQVQMCAYDNPNNRACLVLSLIEMVDKLQEAIIKMAIDAPSKRSNIK